jgi:hypothetical protein
MDSSGLPSAVKETMEVMRRRRRMRIGMPRVVWPAEF